MTKVSEQLRKNARVLEQVGKLIELAVRELKKDLRARKKRPSKRTKKGRKHG